MVLKTGSSSPGELEMTLSTSAVAVCCSSASSRSRVSRATLFPCRLRGTATACGLWREHLAALRFNRFATYFGASSHCSPEARERSSYQLKVAFRKGLAERRPMSALGQKQTCAVQNGMSALPPKADMCSATRHVRFVPIADIATSIRSPRRRG